MSASKNGGQQKRSSKQKVDGKVVSYEEFADQHQDNSSLHSTTTSPSRKSSLSKVESLGETSSQKSSAEKSASRHSSSNVTDAYKPLPYTFRMPTTPSNPTITNTLAKCPPFCLQLDHTLAVIWCLFSKEETEKPLGIAQLQWALVFLQGIYNKKGEHPKDVSLCIQVIQDKLIEQYADLVDDIAKLSPPPPAPNVCHLGTCRDSIKDEVSSSSHSTSRSSRRGDVSLTIKQPFSVNYDEMMKSYRHCGTDRVHSRKPNKTDGDVIKEFKDLKKSLTNFGHVLKSSAIDDKSREEMVNFLKAWRKEQLDKIQSELKRLHSIEEFMTSVDKDNFQPYLDENQFDMLVAKKVKSASGEKLGESRPAEQGNKKSSLASTSSSSSKRREK